MFIAKSYDLMLNQCSHHSYVRASYSFHFLYMTLPFCSHAYAQLSLISLTAIPPTFPCNRGRRWRLLSEVEVSRAAASSQQISPSCEGGIWLEAAKPHMEGELP